MQCNIMACCYLHYPRVTEKIIDRPDTRPCNHLQSQAWGTFAILIPFTMTLVQPNKYNAVDSLHTMEVMVPGKSKPLNHQNM